MKELLLRYEGRVRIAYRDFPLAAIHPQAQLAAEASRCAGEQGKYWEYHDALFANQSLLQKTDLIESARKLRLDEQRFEACVSGAKFRDAVQSDYQDGAKAGVTGTPAFFINGIEDSATGAYTQLLNFQPQLGSWYAPAMVAGQTWTDPYTNPAGGCRAEHPSPRRFRR